MCFPHVLFSVLLFCSPLVFLFVFIVSVILSLFTSVVGWPFLRVDCLCSLSDPFQDILSVIFFFILSSPSSPSFPSFPSFASSLLLPLLPDDILYHLTLSRVFIFSNDCNDGCHQSEEYSTENKIHHIACHFHAKSFDDDDSLSDSGHIMEETAQITLPKSL